MLESSSRRCNRRKKRNIKKGEEYFSRKTITSNVAPEIHPSNDSKSSSPISKSTSETSKKTTIVIGSNCTDNDDYDSTAEYEITFPTVELKLPRQQRRHSKASKSRTADSREHVTYSKSVRKRQIYDSESKNFVTELSSYSYATNTDRSSRDSPGSQTDHTSTFNPYESSAATDVSRQTYNSQQRLQTLGNFFSSIMGIFRNNPRFTKIGFGLILCYVVVCNLEILIPRVIAMIVRLVYPWARYSAIAAEQFFMVIANMFTRMDAVIFASYCDFASTYCRSRRLMCDVTCSIVDHVLSQARPNLSPIPQN